MSARIGTAIGVRFSTHDREPQVEVAASSGGVELVSIGAASFTLTPIEARNYAALLVRAADEVERMRGR
jgi:hypothetical protein